MCQESETSLYILQFFFYHVAVVGEEPPPCRRRPADIWCFAQIQAWHQSILASWWMGWEEQGYLTDVPPGSLEILMFLSISIISFLHIRLSVYRFTFIVQDRRRWGVFRGNLRICLLNNQTDRIERDDSRGIGTLHPFFFVLLLWYFQRCPGWVKSTKTFLWVRRLSKDAIRGAGCVSQANIPSQQTAVPLWWRIWREQTVRRRSPPQCCWGAYTAVPRPRWCRSRLGRWGRPCRRGPLWWRQRKEDLRCDCEVAKQIWQNIHYDLNLLKKYQVGCRKGKQLKVIYKWNR